MNYTGKDAARGAGGLLEIDNNPATQGDKVSCIAVLNVSLPDSLALSNSYVTF